MKKNTFGQQLANLKQKKQLMVMLIFLFVVVITWTAIGLFTSQHKVAVSKDLRELSKPLTPTLNETTLLKLESKRLYTERELENFPIFKVVSTKDGKVSRLVEISSEKEVLDIPPTPVPTQRPSLLPTSAPVESLSDI
jgi:hypothetical protein